MFTSIIKVLYSWGAEINIIPVGGRYFQLESRSMEDY